MANAALAPGERIRVLRLIARMNVGGPALQVSALVDLMDPERFDHRLVVGEVSAGEADFLALRAAHLQPDVLVGLGREVRAGADLRALATLVREIRAFRPHVVHTHTAKAGVLGRVAAKLTGVPRLVHTFHGHLLHGYFSPRMTAAVTVTERALARVTHRLVAVGARVRDELLEAGVGRPDQYLVVPPGVRVGSPPSRSQARATLGLAPGDPVVAFVARLTAIKRPDRALAVAQRLRKDHPDLQLLITGEGPLLPDLRASAGPGVRFLGWRADVETVYAAADLVLLTSDNEGMPVSLIEAALCGRTAVTTDVGSASEVVLDGRTGFVTSAEVEDLARAAERVLANPDIQKRFGHAAKAHADATFSAGRLVETIERLYADLMAATPRVT